MTVTNNFFSHFLHIGKEIFPIFFIAILAAALIEEFVPNEFFEKLSKGKSKGSAGLISILGSSVIGALIPICTCGMIPLAMKFSKKGLNWRIIVAFLTAGNACSIPALGITLVLGLKVTVIRFVAAVLFGVLVTYLLALIIKTTHKEQEFVLVIKNNDCCHEDHSHDKAGSSMKRIFNDLLSMIKDFVPWLIFATLIAAIFHDNFASFSSSQIIQDLNQSQVLGPSLFSIIGFPFYFCAGADIPISRELLQAGVSLGAIITFMTASPGINLTSLLVYKQCIGIGKALIYTLVSIIVAIVLGVAVNYLAY